MAKSPKGSTPRRADLTTSWTLEDAKANFSEVVRQALENGPQSVTVRGRRAVVVVDAQDYDRLVQPASAKPFVEFLEDLHMEGLDLTRERPNTL